ncbi:nitrite reductase small subunit NirD [Photobacterium sp. 1_MG-2023]|uniref:nitrite reductase small subunit NirD n=1 Tax=Photobacterium sp. 1_MG-2023 TaxID=3062646 RepID=UPI0026E39560|nr:nitrite reductase small subunit NirD [Photobacterium sp. 1_MG-2023]MDO6708301.1 nitrite reductase small subunit NirD [Photobacterium sp. 1_MG-2023]
MSWQKICHIDDLVAQSGMGAWAGNQQIALFYLTALTPEVFALDNWDPVGKAYVMARGILGDIQGQPCVASPLYKQHFSLHSGQCLEIPEVRLKVWPVKIEQDMVWVEVAT